MRRAAPSGLAGALMRSSATRPSISDLSFNGKAKLPGKNMGAAA